MAIFPLAPDQTIAQMWSNGSRGGDNKQTYMKTETCKLYPRDFSIFLPNIIKIDPYNFELYRFKVGPFFETQCSNNDCF